jgi:hypothetical protein
MKFPQGFRVLRDFFQGNNVEWDLIENMMNLLGSYENERSLMYVVASKMATDGNGNYT